MQPEKVAEAERVLIAEGRYTLPASSGRGDDVNTAVHVGHNLLRLGEVTCEQDTGCGVDDACSCASRQGQSIDSAHLCS